MENLCFVKNNDSFCKPLIALDNEEIYYFRGPLCHDDTPWFEWEMTHCFEVVEIPKAFSDEFGHIYDVKSSKSTFNLAIIGERGIGFCDFEGRNWSFVGFNGAFRIEALKDWCWYGEDAIVAVFGIDVTLIPKQSVKVPLLHLFKLDPFQNICINENDGIYLLCDDAFIDPSLQKIKLSPQWYDNCKTDQIFTLENHLFVRFKDVVVVFSLNRSSEGKKSQILAKDAKEFFNFELNSKSLLVIICKDRICCFDSKELVLIYEDPIKDKIIYGFYPKLTGISYFYCDSGDHPPYIGDFRSLNQLKCRNILPSILYNFCLKGQTGFVIDVLDSSCSSPGFAIILEYFIVETIEKRERTILSLVHELVISSKLLKIKYCLAVVNVSRKVEFSEIKFLFELSSHLNPCSIVYLLLDGLPSLGYEEGYEVQICLLNFVPVLCLLQSDGVDCIVKIINYFVENKLCNMLEKLEQFLELSACAVVKSEINKSIEHNKASSVPWRRS